jgi:hypothetical protein
MTDATVARDALDARIDPVAMERHGEPTRGSRVAHASRCLKSALCPKG